MSKYAIDPELLPWLDMLPLFEVRDATSLAEVRAGLDQMRDKVTPYEPTHPIDIRDEVVPGPAGAPDVAVRIYRRADREGPQPALFYIHGGGFIMGGLEMADLYAIPIVDKLGIVVVAVDYRLAPETPFPGPVEDCYAALLWTAAKARSLASTRPASRSAGRARAVG